MPSPGRGAILLLLTLVAGCAGAGGEPDDQSLQAASVVRAFANVCGRLEASEIARRGAALGFRPVDPARLPVQAAASFPGDGSVQLMARPSPAPGEAGAILAWNARGPSCELAVARVAPAALEREFDRMLDTLSRSPGLQVQRGQITGTPPTDSAGLIVRRAAVILAPGQAGAMPQAVVLRTATAPVPDGQVQAIMSIHIGRPQQGGAIPPPAPASAR
jgi:hypothetical protein